MRKLALFSLMFFVSLAAACGGGNDNNPIGSGSSDDGVFKGVTHDKYKVNTPKGIYVYSDRPINTALFAEFDKGLDNLFRIAAAPPYNYSGFSLHNTYHIWIFPRSPLCENPAFLVDATGSPYEGSEWDKDPSPSRCVLCAAGMMRTYDGIRNPQGGVPGLGQPGMIITDDIGIAANIVRYEGEHNVLIQVDREKFNATQYHTGTNGGHPILPDPQTNQLVSPHELGATADAQFAFEGERRNILVVK